MLFVVLATSAISCGGGDDHRNHLHGGVPGLVSSSPVDSESRVARDTTLVVELTTELAPESIQNSVVVVTQDGNPVTGTASLIAPHTIGFVPLGQFPGGALLTLRLLPGLLSQSGDTLPSPIEIRFRTESDVRAGSLLINEVYGGTADANGLPSVAAGDDQFVEVVNVSAQSLDLYGVTLSTAAQPRAHVFNTLLLPSGAAVVVWVRAPTQAGAITASAGSLALDLTGSERVVLESTERKVPEMVDSLDFASALVTTTAAADESVTRQVDAGVGDSAGALYVPHRSAPGAGGPRSPGARIQGTLFPTP